MILTILVYVCLFVFRLWINLSKLCSLYGQYFPIKEFYEHQSCNVLVFKLFFQGDLMKRTIKFLACWVLRVYKEISSLICLEQDIGSNDVIIWAKIRKIFWDNSVFVELPNY
jgi:hypothetical protein